MVNQPKTVFVGGSKMEAFFQGMSPLSPGWPFQ